MGGNLLKIGEFLISWCQFLPFLASMKISFQWLQQFVPWQASAAELAEALTLHTAEVEEVVSLAPFFEKVCLAQLQKVTPHPQRKGQHVGEFLVKKGQTKTIVFGSKHPLQIGKIYPIAQPGAKLLSGLEIAEREVGGVSSWGMVCDQQELGLKSAGLWEWEDPKLIGAPLSTVVPTAEDAIIEIDNKSLTHRPDLWGHRGMAREIFARFDQSLSLPEPLVELPTSTLDWQVQLKSEKVSRFCGAQLESVVVRPSDYATQLRLESLGIRSINAVVDITNLILLEYGQPMHVFDADKVAGDIIVRPALAGEKLLALDGVTYELSPEDLVIADEQKVLSIAGIMGGEDSGVTESTKRIIFESANFDATSIRKTSQRLGLRSESSQRFEKSLDPMQCRSALLAAIQLLWKTSPEAILSGDLQDEFPNPPETQVIDLIWGKVAEISGMDWDFSTVKPILERLGFRWGSLPEGKLEPDTVLRLEVPSFRSTKDISIAEDIVEEVVRMMGLSELPAKLPALPGTLPKAFPTAQIEWNLRHWWASNGWQEVMHYSLIDEGEADWGYSQPVEMSNPLSYEQAFLRQSLVYPHWKKMENALRSYGQIKQFEIGKTYHQPKTGEVKEEKSVIWVWSQINTAEKELFMSFKQQLESWLRPYLPHLKTADVRTPNRYVHPNNQLAWDWEELPLLSLQSLVSRQRVVENAPFLWAELNLETYRQLTSNIKPQPVIHHFPPVYRDLSLVVPLKTRVEDLCQTIRTSSEELEQVELFDDFVDEKKIGADYRSIGLRLTFRSSQKTLSETEVQTIFDSLIKTLAATHQAQLRLDFDQISS